MLLKLSDRVIVNTDLILFMIQNEEGVEVYLQDNNVFLRGGVLEKVLEKINEAKCLDR